MEPGRMETDTQTRRTFDYAPGVQINYEVRGLGDKPAVLLHGFGASLETWRPLQPYLEPRFLLYLVDLKGFGLSSKPDDGAYSIEDQASILASFLQRLELADVCLIGHSYGGAVALSICLKLAGAQEAGRVGSLILIDAPATTQRLPFFIRPLTSPLFDPLLSAVPARSRACYVLRRICYDATQVTGERVERYARFLDLPGSHRAMIASARQIMPRYAHYPPARLDALRTRTLILWGEHDRVVPRWQAGLLKEHIPDSKLVILPSCGHMPPEEYPEETAREILSFLAG
jgi:pimeloyl-ACP methyl ester carboxylesterase